MKLHEILGIVLAPKTAIPLQLASGIYDITGIPNVVVATSEFTGDALTLDFPDTEDEVVRRVRSLKKDMKRSHNYLDEEVEEEVSRYKDLLQRQLEQVPLIKKFIEEFPDFRFAYVPGVKNAFFLLAKEPPRLPSNTYFGSGRCNYLIHLGERSVLVVES